MNFELIASRLDALQVAGIWSEDIGAKRYRVGPGFTYWPSTDRWRSYSDRVGGYGVEDLIKAVQKAQMHEMRQESALGGLQC